VKDSTNMNQKDLAQGKKVIGGIMKDHFSANEIKDFEKNGITMEIKKLPPDIAGQSQGNKIYFDPDTIKRADGVTEDVVVHELVHAYNRFREVNNPKTFIRKESSSPKPQDIQNDIEIEEAVTEAITTSRLAKFDESQGETFALERGALNKRYSASLAQRQKKLQEAIRTGAKPDPNYEPFKNMPEPMTREEAERLGVMHSEIVREKYDKERQLNQTIENKVKDIWEKPNWTRKRLTTKEKQKILNESWQEVYGIDAPGYELDVNRTGGPLGNDPNRYELKRYDESMLEADLDTDPVSGAQSNRRYKVGGKVRNFPLAAIGYDKDNLEIYADELREKGFWVRRVAINYDSTTAARRWALFVHPKNEVADPSTGAGRIAQQLAIEYENDPMHPQFGARVRSALKSFIAPSQESLVLDSMDPRWRDQFGEGPIASNVRLFNKEKNPFHETGKPSFVFNPRNDPLVTWGEGKNKYVSQDDPDFRNWLIDFNGPIGDDFAQLTFTEKLNILAQYRLNTFDFAPERWNNKKGNKPRRYNRGNYRLNAIPTDRGALLEQMMDGDPTNRLDERAGQVYGLEDAYVLRHQFMNRGRIEEITVGIYQTQQDAINYANANPLAEGAYEIHEVPSETVLEFYRAWPYYFKRGDEHWIKTGIEGEDIVFESIGFTEAGSPTKFTRPWTEESWEMDETYAGNRLIDRVNTGPIEALNQQSTIDQRPNITNQLFFRKISGKTYRGIGGTLSKPHARYVAQNMRNAGFNARVIPSAKGHRVYLRRRNV